MDRRFLVHEWDPGDSGIGAWVPYVGDMGRGLSTPKSASFIFGDGVPRRDRVVLADSAGEWLENIVEDIAFLGVGWGTAQGLEHDDGWTEGVDQRMRALQERYEGRGDDLVYLSADDRDLLREVAEALAAMDADGRDPDDTRKTWRGLAAEDLLAVIETTA